MMSGCSVATNNNNNSNSNGGIAFWSSSNGSSESSSESSSASCSSGSSDSSQRADQSTPCETDSGSHKLRDIDRSYNSSWAVFSDVRSERNPLSSYHVIQDSAYYPVEDENEKEAERNEKLIAESTTSSSSEVSEENQRVEQQSNSMPKQQSQPLVAQLGIKIDSESPALAWAYMDESKSCYPKDCEKDHRSYGVYSNLDDEALDVSSEKNEVEKEKEKENEPEAQVQDTQDEQKKKEEEEKLRKLIVNVTVRCDQTKFGESLFIIGDWVEWDMSRAVELYTNSDIWPNWTGSFSATKLTSTEYKYYILAGDKQTQIWESLDDGIPPPVYDDTPEDSNAETPHMWTPKARNRIFSGKREVNDVFGYLRKESEILKLSETVDYPIPISIIAKSQFAVIKAAFRGLPVAMKTIPLDSSAAVKQAMNEAETLLSLDHCCIVKIYSSYYDSLDDVVVIVEEFMDRGSLAHIMYKEKRKLNIIQRLRLLLRVIRGIEYIHERGFIHRDIKSPNILVDHNLDAKLCDFGVTRKEAAKFEKMTKIGTPLWMAPEIFIAKHYDCQADIYSFGVVMYEVMEHQLPPERLDSHQIRPSMNCLAPVIKQCLDLSPQYRPRASELRAVLQSTLAEQCRRIADFSNIMPTRENLVRIYEEFKSQPF